MTTVFDLHRTFVDRLSSENNTINSEYYYIFEAKFYDNRPVLRKKPYIFHQDNARVYAQVF